MFLLTADRLKVRLVGLDVVFAQASHSPERAAERNPNLIGINLDFAQQWKVSAKTRT